MCACSTKLDLLASLCDSISAEPTAIGSEIQDLAHSVKYERYVERLRDLQPSGTPPVGIPSLRQCVGTNRLWSAPLGIALWEDLGRDDVSKRDMMDIAVLSRAVLVLEDYLDDEFVTSVRNVDWVRNWISRLEAELAAAYLRIGEAWDSYLQLRRRSTEEVARRRVGHMQEGIFRSSIEKCLIFFSPYRTRIACRSPHYDGRMRLLEAFFFACQLLDDFQDLSEDRNKRLNNNIFLDSTPEVEHDSIVDTRFRWVPALLIAIKRNLMRTEVQAGARDSRVLASYLQAALEYLDAIQDTFPSCVAAEASTTWPCFEEWFFQPLLMAAQHAVPASVGRFIRPEFLQTFSSGYRRIEDV